MLPGLTAFAILASSFISPILGAFLLPLLPAPLAYAFLRYGPANFLSSSAACIMLVSLTGGFPVVTAVALGLSVSAYGLGGSMKAGESDDRAVLKGTLLPVATVGPLVAAYFLAEGVNPFAILQKAMDQGLKESVELYRRTGMSQADIDALMPSLKTFAGILVDYLPAVIVCVLAFTNFFSYYLCKRHAARAGAPVYQGAQMNRWTAPDHVVWGIIVPGFLLIPPVPILRQVAGNLISMFAVVYLFQGMAVTSFLFEKFKLPFALKTFGALVIVLQPFLLLAMWCVGLFDTWADFRKLRPKKS